jgi:hypothetical protein
MMKALNENEPLTFTTLSAATDRVLRKLDEQQNEQCERDSDSERAGKDNPKGNREYVDHRLRELIALRK